MAAFVEETKRLGNCPEWVVDSTGRRNTLSYAKKVELLVVLRGREELAFICRDLPVTTEELLHHRVVDEVDVNDLVSVRLIPEDLQL